VTDAVTETLRAADHLANAVGRLTPAERATPEGAELVDLALDADRLWRRLDAARSTSSPVSPGEHDPRPSTPTDPDALGGSDD
jgi:hypothetical protein